MCIGNQWLRVQFGINNTSTILETEFVVFEKCTSTTLFQIAQEQRLLTCY